jgi:hypothetical protein
MLSLERHTWTFYAILWALRHGEIRTHDLLFHLRLRRRTNYVGKRQKIFECSWRKQQGQLLSSTGDGWWGAHQFRPNIPTGISTCLGAVRMYKKKNLLDTSFLNAVNMQLCFHAVRKRFVFNLLKIFKVNDKGDSISKPMELGAGQ